MTVMAFCTQKVESCLCWKWYLERKEHYNTNYFCSSRLMNTIRSSSCLISLLQWDLWCVRPSTSSGKERNLKVEVDRRNFQLMPIENLGFMFYLCYIYIELNVYDYNIIFITIWLYALGLYIFTHFLLCFWLSFLQNPFNMFSTLQFCQK